MWTALLLILVALCGYILWARRKLYFLSCRLPGPPAWLPIIGNGFALMCKAEDLLNAVIILTEPYPSILRIWLGPRLVIFVKDPDYLQIIMKSPKMATKSFVYQFLEPFMGKGLFTSSGSKHKDQRRLLQPFFSPKILEGYSHLFQKHATNLVKILESHLDGEIFDVLPLLHESAFEATMDILIEDKNDHSVDYKIIPEYVRKFYHIFSQRVISFWMYPDYLFKLTNFYKQQREMTEIVTKLTNDVKEARLPDIIERIEHREINKNEEVRTPSLLEMMVEMVYEQPGCLNENEFLDHIMTFVATSQDTQSSALAFTLMMLGMHQHVQEKVITELNEVLENKKYVHFDDTAKLKYMEMCLNESMRLFPLGPFLPRDVTEDFEMGKWVLPKGSTVMLAVWHVHRDPKLWEKPEEYYPEHFTEEACFKRHPYAFLPFSAGPRRCIAQKYSYTNMKIILSNILQNYKVDCPGTLKDLKLMTDVSVRPIGGYNIKIIRR